MRGTIKVYNGIDCIASADGLLRGVRVGLLTNPSGVNRQLCPSYEILRQRYQLCALFSPEHGFRGDLQAGMNTESYFDHEIGVLVHSLYGVHTIPTYEMLSNIDLFVCDLQDVGARFYTYLYTMTRAMTACAKQHVPVLVLDRINPIGLQRLEGNLLDESFSSLCGEFAVPTRYGLTIGEFARYINYTKNIGCDLTVLPCEGLKRSMAFHDSDLHFISPSPNIPTEKSAFSYIGTCLFEGTNVSEGRGTTHPFEMIGAPWLHASKVLECMKPYELEGVILRKVYFTPMFSKYAGQSCEGIQLHITDWKKYRPFTVGLRLLDEIRTIHSEFYVQDCIDTLFGDDGLRKIYSGADTISQFLVDLEPKLAKFAEKTRPFWLYGE